jgi:predicted dehydrogenase
MNRRRGHGQTFAFQAAGSETSEVWRPEYFNDSGRTCTHTLDRYVHSMVAALRAGEPPPVPATAGRRALQLALAAVEASETGRRVAVGTS